MKNWTLKPLSIAVALSFMSLPCIAGEEIYTGDKTEEAKYVGTGSSINGNGYDLTVKKFEISGQGKVFGIANLTQTNGMLNIKNEGYLQVNNKIDAEEFYIRDKAQVEAGTVKANKLQLINGGTLTVHNDTEVGSFSISSGGVLNANGSLTVNASGNDIDRYSLAKGAALNIGKELILNSTNAEFINAGDITIASGKLDAANVEFRNNGGTLKKSKNEDLDLLRVKALRNNSGSMAVKTLESQSFIYNAEKTAASLIASRIQANSILNGEQGILNSDDSLVTNSLTNKKGGQVTVHNITIGNSLTNGGELIIGGTVESLGKYASNAVTGVVTLEKDASFAKSATGRFTNQGQFFVQGGNFEATGIEFVNQAGAVLAKDLKNDKLDSFKVNALRNDSTIEVGSLNAAKFIYNGEKNSKSSIKADRIITESVLNDNGSTITVSGSLKAGGITNTSGSTMQVGQLIVTNVVNNNSGATLKLTGNGSDIEWLDNAGGTLEAEDLVVSRLLIEDDPKGQQSTVNIDNLTVRDSKVEDYKGRLQFYGTGDVHIGKLAGQGIAARFDEHSGTVNIGTLQDSSLITFYMPDTKANRVIIATNNSQQVGVAVDGSVADTFNPDDLCGSLQQVADTVNIQKGEKRIDVTALSGTILGQLNAKTDSNGNIIWVQEEVNEFNVGISEMASIAMMAWRAENNDLFKRLGDVRRGDHDNGLWTRVMVGESEYGHQNLDNEYTTFQFGYDHRMGAANEWILGSAFTYTNGESSFKHGSGDNYQYGIALYGSYLGENGGYVDVIGKYSHLNNEFKATGGIGKGEYDGNGLSLSVETGYRFDVMSQFYVEPQVEFTYGYLTDVDYTTSAGAQVKQDSMKTAVTRLGVNFGKSFDKGNIHVGASYLKDWEGETSVAMTYKDHTRHYAQDLGDDWFEFEVGGAYAVRDNLNVYGTFETTTGGDVKTPWQANVGVRLTW